MHPVVMIHCEASYIDLSVSLILYVIFILFSYEKTPLCVLLYITGLMVPADQFFTFTLTENIIMTDVKNIMRCVHKRLPHQDNKLNKFLK